MAAWQADFEVMLPSGELASDYRLAANQVLSPGRSWSGGLEVWGTEDGDRIDVFSEYGSPPEVTARFDLREWKPALYERFLTFVRAIGGRLRSAESRADVASTLEEFTSALRQSRAARFVHDPKAYLEHLREHPIEEREAPWNDKCS